MEELTRREVRYWLFRFGTEARGDAKANGAPPGLKAHFEEQMDDLNIRFLNKKDFWDNFAKKWDVDEDDSSTISSKSRESSFRMGRPSASRFPMVDSRSTSRSIWSNPGTQMR